jgi:hypothetical protein
MTSHDQECSAAKPVDIDLWSRRDDRPADKIRRGRRTRAVGHERKRLHDSSRAALNNAVGTDSQGARASRSGSQSFIAYSAHISGRSGRDSPRCRRPYLSDMVHLRAGRDEPVWRQDDSGQRTIQRPCRPWRDARRFDAGPGDESYRIDITVDDKKVTVRDNGIGMLASELEGFFWTIGASGKRTQEAQTAGCVGMFGIGGFANFGVCDTLEVISQTDGVGHGTLTRLSESDIRKSGAAIPSVTVEKSDAAAPRGTIVIGTCGTLPILMSFAVTSRTSSNSCLQWFILVVAKSRRPSSQISKIVKTSRRFAPAFNNGKAVT